MKILLCQRLVEHVCLRQDANEDGGHDACTYVASWANGIGESYLTDRFGNGMVNLWMNVDWKIIE